ncbi:c-type cytochrome [Pseudomonadota bacterium]
MFSVNAWASADMQEGRQLMQSNCMACHHVELDPPMGPPMFAVQMRYKRVTTDRASFIERLTAFTMHPSEERAVMQNGIEQLGLMPDIGADEGEVRKVAAYIHDETFAPPCEHWKIGMKIAKAQGDTQHFKKDQMMFNRMCLKLSD